jgi:hypothetical protein
MNYTEVRREIGRRLGDPDLKKYRGLVGQCFISSMCQLLENEENYNLEEISGLVIEEQVPLVFDVVNKSTVNIKDDAIQLLDVYQNEMMALGAGYTFYEATPIEFKRMALERAFRPTEREIFWFRRANKIHFIKSEQVVGTPIVVLQYLMNPDPTTWQDNTNLITGENFSRNFLYKVIGKTVENITSYPAFNVGQS